MKTHGKWCGDSSEIQAIEASESQAIDLTEDDKPLLEVLKPQGDNDNIAAQNDEGCSSQAKIEKVRHFLLKTKDSEKHFAPMEISVGPLHASRFKKELKLKLAKKFITNSGKTPESFLTKIKHNIQELKRRFGKGVICEDSYNDDSLARLLFLDGCAVLQFVYSCVFNELDMFKIDSTQAAFIQQDLFLFENQIPFKALTLLMDVLDEGEIGKDVRKRRSYFFKVCIIQFVHENNIFANVLNNYVNRRNYCQVDIRVLSKIKPAHLLDLLRKVSIFGSIMDVEVDEDEDEDEDDDDRDDGNKPVTITICDQSKKCLPSLDCFRKQEDTTHGPQDMETFFRLKLEKHERVTDRSLRGVQELKSVGIAMKISESRSLKSASFGTNCLGIFGHLKLPALKFNDSTVRKLLNLVAYEMCLDVKKRCYAFTSYLNFLDFLIDTEEDVKKLRTAGVLLNALGSDAEAARLFNTLGLTYLPKYDEDHFEKIHSKIEEHYGGKYKIGVARTYTAYVENPWPTLGLFLTLIALLFTVVQTWYAINPIGSKAEISFSNFPSL